VVVSDGIQTHHDTIRVAVGPPLSVFAGNDTTVCSYTGSIQLNGVASNYKSFEWGTSGNGLFTNHSILNPIYNFGSHDYLVDSVDLYLVAFALSPCVGRITSIRHLTLDPCTGVQTNTNDQNLILQPNPARESVSIIITGLENKPVSITVTDMKGQTLYSEEITGPDKSVTKRIDLKKYPSGIYFIKVRTDKNVFTKELVVAR
jgi:hypothetical protein